MNSIFENGLAKETATVTVYGYSHKTGEFVGEHNVRVIIGTGIPAFSTLVKPPEQTTGKTLVFNNEHWLEVTDNRGKTAYAIDTGEPVTVTELGDLRPGFTLTSPGTPYDKWDGEKWITDTAAQHSAAVAEANTKKSALLDEANAATADWRTELALGIISDSDKTKLIAWMAYIRDVKATDTSTAPNVAFPSKPE